MIAKPDGYRVYKIRDKGLRTATKAYIAPVYVIGLPGDVELFNRELEILSELSKKAVWDGIT